MRRFAPRFDSARVSGHRNDVQSSSVALRQRSLHYRRDFRQAGGERFYFMPYPTRQTQIQWHNRIREIMAHTRRYAFGGEAKLARDIGVARSTLNRFLNDQSHPSFPVLFAIAEALGEALDTNIEPREIVSRDGSYPTPSVCDLCGCRGCALSSRPKTIKRGR